MKKTNVILPFVAIVMAGFFLFSACNNAFSPSAFNTSQGQDNVTVSFSGGLSARTLLPSALDFDLYEFTFIKDGTEYPFSREKSPGGSFTFSVPVGTGYTLSVIAYKVNGSDKIPAAEGNSGPELFEVKASGTSVPVRLVGNLSGGAAGAFSYTVQYPGNAAIDHIILTGISGVIDLLGVPESEAGGGKLMSHSAEIAAGWYEFEIRLSIGERLAFYYDIVRIYSNTTTFYGTAGAPRVFTNKNFLSPNAGDNKGELVYLWNSFDVEGKNHYLEPSFEPSLAVGTRYETFVDADGITWNDVLKLEPPAGGYNPGTLALTRPTVEDGNYYLSMWYWVDKGEEKASVFWYDTGGKWGDSYGWEVVAGSTQPLQNEDYGAWHFMEGTFYHWADDEIGISARFGNDGSGLRDSTIYIRNIVLLYNGEPLVDDGNLRFYSGNFTLNEGHDRTLTVNKPAYWSIAPAGVASLDAAEHGLSATVTAKSAGIATITAVSRENPEQIASVTITVIEEDIFDLRIEVITLIPGGSFKIRTNFDVNWSDYDSNIITVDSAGTVTGLVIGATTITATQKDNLAKVAHIPVKVISKGAGTKYLAFTFDDGPEPEWTPRFHELLSGLGAHATFFCMGYKLDAYPEVALANSEAGNEIGNHTYYHTMALQHESVDFIRAELERTQISIKNATGKDNKVFRGPALQYSHFGDIYAEVQYGENLEEAARQLGLALIDGVGHQAANFDFNPSYSPEDIARINAEQQAKEWAILLMHDGWPDNVANTYKALPILVEKLYAQGYEILTVSELAAKRKAALGLSPASDLEPGRIYYDLAKMPEHVSSITVKNSGNTVNGTIGLESGQTINLTAVIAPEGAAVQELYWYSDNPGIAAVSNGAVTAYSPGTTAIRVAAGGMRTVITVMVDEEGPGPDPDPDPIETITEWKDTQIFKLSGEYTSGNSFFYGSEAGTEICNGFEGFDNVLKLSSPVGGYYTDGSGGSVAMTYVVQQAGTYTLTMDVWVDSVREDVNLLWYECGKWGDFKPTDTSIDNSYYLETGKWISRTGTCYVLPGRSIGLLAASYLYPDGLKNATIYIKNFKLVREDNDEILIDITGSPAVPPETGSPGVTLDWDDGDFSMLEKSITISEGQTVTITPQGSFDSYEWSIDRVIVGTDATYQFTGTNKGTYKILLWVDGSSKGASITVVVE